VLNFEKTYETVIGKQENIYCQIEFEYEEESYNLLSKCEYINYGINSDKNKYLQPSMGYVPFIYKKQLKYAYVVLNTTEKENGYLEFVLNEKTEMFDIENSKNLLKTVIKIILNKFFFFIKKNDFTKIISIKKNKIFFFNTNNYFFLKL
jgi:hypothetical protein|tara:strand:- start:689 stop:1135 length:447 start_codon:yes stop_codon:yes gene_type:complete